MKPKWYWGDYADIMNALVLLSFSLSVLMKPLRTDAKYMRILYGHLILQGIICEILSGVGSLRLGLLGRVIACCVRSMLYVGMFKLGLKIRGGLSELSREDLSNFLVNRWLAMGAACMTTILFFLFEVISCWIENEDDSYCSNSLEAASYLSVFLIVFNLTSVIRRAVPVEVRSAMEITKERIASFHLKKREMLQTVLLALAGGCTLYLLSSLGVFKPYDSKCYLAGMVGLVTLAINFVVEAKTLVHKGGHSGSSGGGGEASVRRDRKLSSGTLHDGMGVIGSML